MELSIIIVNWNSLAYLRVCLTSLYRAMSDLQYEIVVIDNASEENCRAILQEYPLVRLIQARNNIGFARANNLGYAQSSGDIVLFLNPDTEVKGDDLTRLIRYLKANPNLGAAGPCLLNTDGSVQTSCVQALPTVWNQFLDCDFLRRRFPAAGMWGLAPLLEKDKPEAEVISGACMAVKREVFETVGGFSEEYFMYADDLDLSYRIHEAGYKIHCFADCRVVHHGGKSSSQRDAGFADILKRTSIALFLRKTRGASYSRAYRALTAIAALLRIGLVACVVPFAGRSSAPKSDPRLTLRKWFRILKWAVKPAGSPSDPACLVRV
jgi:hypothetical protein